MPKPISSSTAISAASSMTHSDVAGSRVSNSRRSSTSGTPVVASASASSANHRDDEDTVNATLAGISPVIPEGTQHEQSTTVPPPPAAGGSALRHPTAGGSAMAGTTGWTPYRSRSTGPGFYTYSSNEPPTVNLGDGEEGGGEGEGSDVCSSVSSNPTVWDNNIPRKLLDFNWYFSANPLRVTDCSGKQWSRLHATYRSMIPQPNGGVLFLKQKYPHRTDEELYRQVFASGVAKPRRQRQLPPLPPRAEVNTPVMRERLKKAMMPPVPKRAFSLFPPPDPSDASSCFSVSQAPTNGGSTAVASAAKRSAASSSRKGKENGSASGIATSSVASGSKLSRGASSTRSSALHSRIEMLTEELAKEREERKKCADEVSLVSEKLSQVEKLLERK